MGYPVPEIGAVVADISYGSQHTDPIIFTTYFKERARAQLRLLLRLVDDAIIIKDRFVCLQRARTAAQRNPRSVETPPSLSDKPLRDCANRMSDNQRRWIATVRWLASEWNNDQAHQLSTTGMMYVLFAYTLFTSSRGDLYFQ